MSKSEKQVLLEGFELTKKSNKKDIFNYENKIFKKEPNYWIHRVDLSVIKNIHKNKIIGGKKRLSKSIDSGDRILLVSNIEGRIRIFGYTVVDECIQNEEVYYNYTSRNKLKIKGMKYFIEPIIVSEIAEKLSFVKNPKISSSYFNSEWKQITKEDFKYMTFKVSLSNYLPSYLKEVRLLEDEFIFKTIKVICSILKSQSDKKQIEIEKIISILKVALDSYGFNKTNAEVYDFYTKNIYKLGLKHNPSRYPEKSVPLYTPSGSKRNFTYLSLER